MAVIRFCLTLAGTLAAVGCSPSPVVSPTAESVYLALVEAGCLAPDEAGPSDIAQESALGDAGFPWLSCLFDGGTISTCNVPCDQ